MIVVKLQGGLGNQMFQYALGRHLALKNKTKLVLDLSFLRRRKDVNYTVRDYGLDIFKLNAARHRYAWGNRFLYPLLKKTLKMRHIREASPAFEPDVLSAKGNIYLDGFWQSERYFKDIKATIINDFNNEATLKPGPSRLVDDIRKCNSVSVHIRRGDYTDKNAPTTYVDLFAEGYYENAINRINRLIDDPVFFFFSDDREWLKKNIPAGPNYRFTAYEDHSADGDLYLMRHCKHHIIANSSFSWWGAWLNSDPDKIVIAPEKWFLDPMIVTDIVPPSWRQI